MRVEGLGRERSNFHIRRIEIAIEIGIESE